MEALSVDPLDAVLDDVRRLLKGGAVGGGGGGDGGGGGGGGGGTSHRRTSMMTTQVWRSEQLAVDASAAMSAVGGSALMV